MKNRSFGQAPAIIVSVLALVGFALAPYAEAAGLAVAVEVVAVRAHRPVAVGVVAVREQQGVAVAAKPQVPMAPVPAVARRRLVPTVKIRK